MTRPHPHAGGRARDDRGQATVELALVLPLVALVLAALVQAVVVARDQLLVVHAAREAARAAAVDPAPGAAMDAAELSGPLDPRRLDVDVSGRGRPGAGSGPSSAIGSRPTCRSSAG